MEENRVELTVTAAPVVDKRAHPCAVAGTNASCVSHEAIQPKGNGDADAVVQCPTQALLLLAAGADKKFRGVAKIEGDASRFDLLLASLHRFADGAAGDFNIVEP